MAELGAFFGNPNIQRQGARARALAAQRDVNTLADPRTYAVVQGLLGTAPDEMGFSVLNPDYEKIKKVAEPAFALGLLGQASPLLAPMTKGLPVGASIKNVGKDLSAIQIGDRTIPVTINRIDKKSGGELVNVNPSAFDEAFSKTSWQYVGEKGKDGISGRYEKFQNFLKDAKSIEASNVSVNKDGGVVFGDGRHRYAVLRDMGLDELPIVMDKESIKNAKKFGYLADTKAAPRQEALDTAQRNAALPIEEGGLGLPKDNTPEMRAQAMGFDTETLHGTAKDFTAFDLSKAGTNTRQAGDELGIFSTSKPFLANDYALIASRGGWAGRTEPENAVVYPLVGSFKNPKKYQTASEFYRDADAMAAEQKLGQWREQLQKEGYDSVFVRPDLEEVVAFSPSQLRSRFAAFDPMRRNETDILAGVLPLGLLADEEQRKKLYELMPSLLGE